MAETRPRSARGRHAGMSAQRLDRKTRRGGHRHAQCSGGSNPRNRSTAPQDPLEVLRGLLPHEILAPAADGVISFFNYSTGMLSAMNPTRIGLVLSYAAALVGSLWLGYQLRFDFAVPEETERTFLLVFAWVISFKLVCLWRLRQFE